MAYVVEMNRINPDDTLDMYDCGAAAWDGLLDIGKRFGWVPMGTIWDQNMARANPDYERQFTPSYVPCGWGREKCFSDDDARALSVALQAALLAIQNGTFTDWQLPRSNLIREDDDFKTYTQVNASATAQLEQFVAYAARGGFSFGWDD